MNPETTPRTNSRTRTELLLLAAFCGFLFFYGLGAFGLLGADEPRYAQIAREMLDRSDWITPTSEANRGSKSRRSITGRPCSRFV
jgi:4-amino-4-deoxy-L-arabinose transferase-like glycosyltransferase